MNLLENIQLAKNSAGYPHVEVGHDIFNFSSEVLNRIEKTKQRVDRVQIMAGPGERQFLVRHSTHGHFGGYVIVDQKRWDRVSPDNQRLIRDRCRRWSRPMSFCGENNSVIAWCSHTTRGKLNIPGRINPDGPDLILGFDTQGMLGATGKLLDNFVVTNLLFTFAQQIREGLDDYSGV